MSFSIFILRGNFFYSKILWTTFITFRIKNGILRKILVFEKMHFPVLQKNFLVFKNDFKANPDFSI
jgi:hypothetical protein